MSLPDGTQITLGSISALELVNSGKVSWTDSGIEGERIFLVEWSQRLDLVEYLLGSSEENAAGTKQVSDTSAQFPGINGVLCKEVQMTPMGTMTQDVEGDPVYEWAKIVARYRSNTDGDENDEDNGGDQEAEVIGTLDIDFSTQYLAYGSYEAKWSGGDPVKDPIPRAKLIVTIPRRYEQSGLASIPDAQIRAKIGKVNQTAFDGVEAGKLLFTGASSRKQFKADGSIEYNITYEFVERPVAEWNKFFNSKTQDWDTLMTVATDTDIEPYDTADFSDLLNNPLALPVA